MSNVLHRWGRILTQPSTFFCSAWLKPRDLHQRYTSSGSHFPLAPESVCWITQASIIQIPFGMSSYSDASGHSSVNVCLFWEVVIWIKFSSQAYLLYQVHETTFSEISLHCVHRHINLWWFCRFGHTTHAHKTICLQLSMFCLQEQHCLTLWHVWHHRPPSPY